VTVRASRELTAITHLPSPGMERGERTYVGAASIDYARALTQHAAYCGALAACGARVLTLDANCDLPDCVFVEDAAIVLDEVAVLMSMGAPSRRGELELIAEALRPFREMERIALPARIDGGDVVCSGHSLFVGASSRTDADGIAALRALVERHGYSVTPVPVRGCLHLKTSCSALPDGRFLVNPAWIDVVPLAGSKLLPVPASEPWAADVLPIGEAIIVADAFPATRALLERQGFRTVPVTVSEFAKAEGGVTCLSLIVA
jgi:dimethylargininase